MSNCRRRTVVEGKSENKYKIAAMEVTRPGGGCNVVYNPQTRSPDASCRLCVPMIKAKACQSPGNPPGFPALKFFTGHSGTNFRGIITTG